MRPFEQIVAEYGPAVLRVCRAMLGPADAEDAWAETFLAALKAYPGLDEHAHVEAWLVTIAHRKGVDALRARSRRPLLLGHAPEAPARPGWPDGPGVAQHTRDESVDATRLARSGRTGDQDVRHLREVRDDETTFDVLAERHCERM